MAELKNQFNKLRDNPFFLEIIRGSFQQKFCTSVTNLESLYYVSQLECYLQEVTTFMEKLLAAEQKIINNRKSMMSNVGTQISQEIENFIVDMEELYQNGHHSVIDLIENRFNSVREVLLSPEYVE